MVDVHPLMEALAEAGVRSTEPRRAVAELIAERAGHFTARDLVDDAADRRLAIGRATVFRALELFADLGLVERLDLPTGEHAYVACEPTQHHHHVVCSRCGRSTEVDDCGMSEVAREVARRTGYRIERHRLELFGVCPDCRHEPAAASAR
jgi:Fe2+ or Zn2+ uptake regulation protein